MTTPPLPREPDPEGAASTPPGRKAPAAHLPPAADLTPAAGRPSPAGLSPDAAAPPPPDPAAGDLSSPDIVAVAEALWELWRVWRRRSHPITRRTVTPEQYYLLRHLQKRGPMTVSGLARELGVTAATVTAGTRRLEAAGYVRRERQSADQRVVTLSLSEAGAAATDAWLADRRRALVGLLARLQPEERSELGRMLSAVLEGER